MLEQEIIQEFNYRTLTEKTNNFIFTGVNDFKILDNIPDRCSILLEENNIDIDFAQNIKIDLAEINLKDILSYALELLKKMFLLDVTLDYTLNFNSKFDLITFQGVLRNYKRVIQLIFYNVEVLLPEEQALFNEIYYFNSIFFNANSFIKGEGFQSYFLNDQRVLDNRENYNEIRIINLDKSHTRESGLYRKIDNE